MSKHPIKAALLQVHSAIGITIALILAVVGITGAVMSFEDEIGASLNAGVMRVEPRSTPMLSPDALIERLRAAHDFGEVAAVTMSSDPAAAVRVRFARSEGGSQPNAVYVDPYDGRVLGAPRGEEFFATVRKLHRWLLLPGDGKGYGRQITGAAAIGLIAMLVSGLVLRWPRHARNIKAWLKPNLALRGRGFHWSLHAVAGTWVMAIYLVSVLTGLWFSYDWYKNGATWLLSGRTMSSAPAQARPPAPARAAGEASPTFDRVWSAFLQTEGGRFATAQFTLPSDGGSVIRIRSWTRDAWSDGARDEFRIDAVTGRVILSELYATKPVGEKILANVLDIHRGSILGWPGKLLFMLAAATMPLIAVTGFILYLSRRKYRRMLRRQVLSLAPGE